MAPFFSLSWKAPAENAAAVSPTAFVSDLIARARFFAALRAFFFFLLMVSEEGAFRVPAAPSNRSRYGLILRAPGNGNSLQCGKKARRQARVIAGSLKQAIEITSG